MTKNTRQESARTSGTGARPLGNGYDFSFSLGRTAVHTPQVSLPNLGSRWISVGMTLILGLLLYTMATSNAFKVTAVNVIGNQRLSTSDISASVGLAGKPLYNAIPSQIVKNLEIAFPDLASVKVSVGFPNSLRITVTERTPVMIWSQDGKTQWIDANGIAFPVRGDMPGLVQVVASGNPPMPPGDQNTPADNPTFIDPAMVQGILSLFPEVPVGAPMAYDPKYGLGWQDTHGWSVYFGQNAQQIETKKKVYQAILDTFTQQGIQPTLVSVAYLDAPFYK